LETMRKRLRRDGVVPIEHKSLAKSDHVKESVIERDCLRWANEHGGFYAIKIPSIGVFDSSVGAYRKASPYAVNGISDLCLLRDGRAFWCEIKRPGGVQSMDQKKFQRAVESKGFTYVLIHSLQELQDYVEEWFGV